MENKKNEKTQITINFLQKVKDGEYTSCNTENLKPMRSPVYREDTNTEDQYYYSTR